MKNNRIFLLLTLLALIGYVAIFVGLISPSFLPTKGKSILLPENIDVSFSYSSNLANNSSFEEGAGGAPNNWVPTIFKGSGLLSWATDYAKNGKYSVKLESTTAASVAWCTDSFKRYLIDPGNLYRASIWVKTDNVNNARINIAWYDRNSKWLSTTGGQPISGTNEWQEIFVEGGPPSDASQSGIELFLEGTGVAWYDEVRFEQSKKNIVAKDNSWEIQREQLMDSEVHSDGQVLKLQAKYKSTNDEWLAFSKDVSIDVSKEHYFTLTSRTSDTGQGKPGLFVIFRTQRGRDLVQPLALSTEWTTTIIDLSRLIQKDSLSPETRITSVSIQLNDWDNTLAEGVFSGEVRDLRTSDTQMADQMMFAGAALVLFLVILSFQKKTFTWVSRPSFGLLLAVLSVSGATWGIFIPFINFQALKIISFISSLVAIIIMVLEGTEKQEKSEVWPPVENKVFLIIGLVLIPWIAFLIRLNTALTTELFGDELSYGLMSWGLFNKHALIGAYLSGPWQPDYPIIFKEVFVIEPYPTGLSLPYTRDWMQGLQIVHPFFATSYLLPLFSSPFIAIMGFSAIAIRLPYILLSVVTVVCLFLVGKYFSNVTAIIGSSFLAVSPLAVTFGSGAFLDGGVALFLVLTLLFYLKYHSTGKSVYLYIAAVAAGFGLLSKLSGAYALFFLTAALLVDSNSKGKIIKILGISLVIFSTFIISGVAISYRAFIEGLRYLVGYSQIAQQYSFSMKVPMLRLVLTNWETALGLSCLMFVLSYTYAQREQHGEPFKLLMLIILAVLVPWTILFSSGWQAWLLVILPLLSLALGEMVYLIRREDMLIPGTIFTLLFLIVTFQNFGLTAFIYYRQIVAGSFLFVALIGLGRQYTSWFTKVSLANFIQRNFGDICVVYITVGLVAMATVGFQVVSFF